MKKKLTAALLALVLVLAVLPTALAAAPTLVVTMKINSPWCVIGSQVTQVDESNSKVTPVAERSRTLMPIRRVLEAFGGQVEWVPETNGVLCSLNGTEVELTLDSTTALVNGQPVELDVPAKAMNNRTFVPVRFVSENLGLTVEYESTNQIVIVADGGLDAGALTSIAQVKTLVEKTRPKGDPTSLTTKTYTLPSGKVTASVIRINMSDPRVTVKANVPYGLLNVTRSFDEICAASGATAVINANFFEAYKDVKDPIGHIMVNGQFVYGSTGRHSLGITADGEMRYGQPALFFRVKTVDGGTAQAWSGYEVNTLKQFAKQATLYTRARGASVPITYPGAVLVVEGGVTTDYRTVSAGETVSIPSNGFVLYYSKEVTATNYFKVPELGRKVEIEPYLFKEDAEGFTLDGVQTIVSGGPRLVKDGAIVTTLESMYTSDSRFTTQVSPRTAVGSTADNKLLLVSTSAASIQQMRELMDQLGCEDAINLDGGGSTAMYYKGNTIYSPGRKLVTTLQVFVSE